MAQFWTNDDGTIIVDGDGLPYYCDDCPCETTPPVEPDCRICHGVSNSSITSLRFLTNDPLWPGTYALAQTADNPMCRWYQGQIVGSWLYQAELKVEWVTDHWKLSFYMRATNGVTVCKRSQVIEPWVAQDCDSAITFDLMLDQLTITEQSGAGCSGSGIYAHFSWT